MTLHQRKIIANILGNIALDLHNTTSGQLEVNLHNLRHVRADKRPDGRLTMADVEQDLLKRNN